MKIRLIDSLKFYQRNLSELSYTLTAEKKNAVKKVDWKILKWTLLVLHCLPISEFKKER